jgi:flagellar biosynthetic protein FlhB
MAESSEDRDQRQLPASERKLQKARDDGQVPRSREVAHAAALLAALATAAAYGPTLAERIMAMVRGTLRFDRALSREPQRALELASAAAGEALWAVLPLLAAPLAAAAFATLAIGGLVWSTKPITPDLTRLDPMKGLERIFSRKALVDLLKLAAIALAVGSVGGVFVSDGLSRFAALAGLPLPAALSAAAGDLRMGLALIAAVVVVAALADGPLQIWRHHDQLKMSLKEVRDEYKQTEGDPHVRAARRERQRAMSRGRMLAAVPTADVVVTNPTHFAVALEYVDGEMGAPRVVAKGADLLAARIREIATDAGVPILEAPPLARALYTHVEVDREIPAPLYAAVAQVLAWVYQLQQHAAGRGARPTEPGVVVPPGLDPLESRT